MIPILPYRLKDRMIPILPYRLNDRKIPILPLILIAGCIITELERNVDAAQVSMIAKSNIFESFPVYS